jgi:DNA-binding transcriptional ArsR family regulator
MVQLNHDYTVQTEAKRYGILESASKRVRMIFSVMASPNRIDILRILNSKGPLTYSELKSLAGFKSKKESGKFAYHLRKLLRQSLVALNKGERRYTITNLGKLVLSLARQIEERSIVESGKMYVRTSHDSIEEFDSHKIIQSLVREAGMPLEQAQKITEEVENKVYKFQSAYLTSSLVRESVNSVLIEHGYEEYRNRMSRLGMPTSDVFDLLTNADRFTNGVEEIFNNASMSVFSEHLLLNSLPKDIADMHLAGELHISNPGVWGLVPDVVFLNAGEFAEEFLNLKGKLFNVSRLRLGERSQLSVVLQLLISLMSREASSEIIIESGGDFLLNSIDREDIASSFANSLVASSAVGSYSNGLPSFTILLPISTLEKKTFRGLLEGYTRYTDITPLPRIGLALDYTNDPGALYEDSAEISSVVRSGGKISIMQDGERTSSGIRKSLDDKNRQIVASLQSMSINLPRLAYQSNKDETYFRAKLALTIKPALEAMDIRRKNILEGIRKGLFPIVRSANFENLGSANIIINLTGLRESVYDILGHDHNSALDVVRKVMKTSDDIALERGRQMGIETVGISMVSDDSSTRFAHLDSEKYGKTLLSAGNVSEKYSQGITLSGKEILTDSAKNQNALEEYVSIDNLLRGGLSMSVDLTDISMPEEANKAIIAASKLKFFRPFMRSLICSACSRRHIGHDIRKCETCGSSYLKSY